MTKIDEATFNQTLAEVLRTKNPRWREPDVLNAEPLGFFRGSGKPDLTVMEPGGVPVLIETEFAPARTVENDAKSRLGRDVRNLDRHVDQVIALRAPAKLRGTPQPELRETVGQAHFEYCVWSSAEAGNHSRWPTSGWLKGDCDALADLVENLTVSKHIVDQGLQILEQGVIVAAGVMDDATKGKDWISEGIAEELHQEHCEQTTRMAMAIVANALTFHAMISEEHDIKSLDRLHSEAGNLLLGAVLEEWTHIMTEINYWPIFNIARDILCHMPGKLAARILKLLAKTAEELVALGVTRSHDLSGRMFQRLISDRKFLATFYTSPPAAALLTELAIARLDVDWGDPKKIKSLRIGDLACGTGTLLVSAYNAVLGRHRRQGGDDRKIHSAMIEEALVAADIMPASTHLTISMLSSVHPACTFQKTQVHTLHYGEGAEGSNLPVGIGSLDLIASEGTQDLFATGVKVIQGRGKGRKIESREVLRGFSLSHNSLDAVVMNPPFTRPTNHEQTGVPVPSFAGFATSDDEQGEMSRRLRDICKKLYEPAGHGNAGLASNFIDLAHTKLRPGGVFAMVLPQAFLQGESWAASRHLMARHYEKIMIISIAAEKAEDKSFSADTSMGEILLLARKRMVPQDSSEELAEVDYVTLKQKPQSVVDATEMARSISGTGKNTRVKVGGDTAGSAIRSVLSQGGCASVLDASLAHAAMSLQSGLLMLPRRRSKIALPMTTLESLGARGRGHRDINGVASDGTSRGPFDILAIEDFEQPTYPVLWAHHAGRERKIIVAPDCAGSVRVDMERDADKVWRTATKLHFSLDFGLSSQSLAACCTQEPTIGGRAWPNFKLGKVRHEAAMVLWANTTLGLMMFWWHGNRQHPGRSIVTISGLPFLAVLDTAKLTKAQHAVAHKLLKKFGDRELLPANEAYHDPVRKDLDRAVLVDLLGLPATILKPLDLLRRKWCAEPTVHGGKATKIQS